jgi:hypothetical protein
MRLATAGFLLLTGVLVASPLAAQEKSVEAKIVKYDALKEVVAKNKGKVVVVDFWGID